MKIAIISDIHENSHNLVLFLKEIEKHNIERILFLWDFINNGIAKLLATAKMPVFAVWWNNDWDKVAITKTSLSKWSNLEIGFTTFDNIEIDWKKIFLSHYPMLAKPMAKSWDFDAVFYGHNHEKNIETIWDCLVLNPWEISAHKTNIASFGVYNTTTNTWELFELNNSISIETDISAKHRKNIKFEFWKTKAHQY